MDTDDSTAASNRPAAAREESANVKLAESLKPLVGRAFTVTAEVSGRADRKLPDIEIQYGKLHIVLEAKYDDFDAAVEAAQNRWHEMQPRPDMVGAVSYAPLYRTDFEGAIRAAAPVEFALCGGPHQDLHAARRSGEIYDLAQALRRPYSVLSRDDDRIENAVNRIKGALAFFVDYVDAHPGMAEELAELLQAGRNGGDRRDAFSQSARMGGLIVFGAALFQIALAKQTSKVKAPEKVIKEGVRHLEKHWRYIVAEINYHAIFRLAADILALDVSGKVVSDLIDVARDVEDIAHDGIDLMGRIYHQLLADAKTLGAFYTTIPAATMMAGLALHADDWRGVNWASAKSVGKLRIADPACGSGTLLAAAAWQLLDNFSRAHFRRHGGRIGGEQRADPRARLCRLLLEDSIWGYDILETAAHLTAATLGLISPQTDFKKTHIYRTIIGETALGTATGSLEMLEGTMPIFRREEHIESGDTEAIPPLDLCIMNPPFVRGTAGNELFGFLPEKEKRSVRKRMRDLGKSHGFSNDKGQGAGFMALACLKRAESSFIRDGGRLAAILPATAVVGSGKTWTQVRAKIEADFDLETVIVSRETGRANFSEDTVLQECILIARKRKAREKPRDTALFVVLHKNPATVNAALATVQAIRRAQKGKQTYGDLRFVESARGKAPKIVHDAGYIGQYARLPWRGKSAWHGVSFAHMRLAFAAESFAQSGELRPYSSGRVTLRKLGDLATLGGNTLHLKLNHPDFKRLSIAPHKTFYAGYYPSYHKQKTGVAHRDSARIVEPPHCHLLPHPGHESWMDVFYKRAGRIVLNESFRFNTVRRLAALVSEPVQASHYWPIALHDESEEKLKTMTLWLNSTPALLLIASGAQSTHGAKVGFSKKAAMEMPALDVSALSAAQLKRAAKAFDALAAGDDLLPLPHMENDAQRKRIDDALSEVLGLGDLSKLRGALAVEPIITGKGIGAAD